MSKQKREEQHGQVSWGRLRNLGLMVVVLAVATFTLAAWGGLVLSDPITLGFLNGMGAGGTFWADAWRSLFSSPLNQQWVKLTYAWDFDAAGRNLYWFHIVNIYFHAVSCLALFALVFRLAWRFKNEGRLGADPYLLAFGAAALFACHPLAVEPVAYISARSAPLMTCNYLLALSFFLVGFLSVDGAAVTFGYFAALILTFISLASEAGGITAPLSMLVLSCLLKRPSVSWKDWLSESGWVMAALFVTVAAVPYLFLLGSDFPAVNGIGQVPLSLPVYLASECKALVVYYLRCFVLPVGLSVEPPWLPAAGWHDPFAVAGALLLLGSLPAMWMLRQRPLWLFGLYLAVVGLLPRLFIVQAEFVADRHFYLSLAGLCILASALAAGAKLRSGRTHAIACGVLLLVLSGLSIWRIHEWSSDTRIWRSARRWNPDSSRASAALSMVYFAQGKSHEAALLARETITKDPESALGFLSIALNCNRARDYAGAQAAASAVLERARRQSIADVVKQTAYEILAWNSYRLKDYKGAMKAVIDAQKDGFETPGLQMAAGCSLEAVHEYKKAFEYLAMALGGDPRLADAYAPMTRAAVEVGIPEYAVRYARLSLARDKSPENKVLFARAVILQGLLPEGSLLLQEVVKEDPKNAEALACLSVIAKAAHNEQPAAEYRRQATEVDPDVFSRLGNFEGVVARAVKEPLRRKTAMPKGL